MNFNEMYPSRFLKANDIDEVKGTILTTRRREPVIPESMGEGQGEKPVLYFEDSDKGLVLNKTNASMLATMYGDDSDGWAGKKIFLIRDMVQFQGKLTPTIRIKYAIDRNSTPAPAATQAAVVAEEPKGAFDDIESDNPFDFPPK